MRCLYSAAGLAAVLVTSVPAQQPPPWRWTTGARLGVVLNAGVIGRQPNATGGHEMLLARLGWGFGLGFHAGYESRLGGVELRALALHTPVEVSNEDGIEFPHHGSRPVSWTAGVLGYPLAPVLGRRSAIRPFVTAGVGGVILTVDLDNIKGQTLYHSFQWSLGGGVRIGLNPEDIPTWTPAFVELRFDRTHVWANGPLNHFVLYALSAGLGMRL